MFKIATKLELSANEKHAEEFKALCLSVYIFTNNPQAENHKSLILAMDAYSKAATKEEE